MRYLYVDIETIPCQTNSGRERLASNVKPPAQMKKAETIAAWEKNDKLAAIEEAISRSGLDGAYGHICCVGYAFDDEPAEAIMMDDELSTLVAFAAEIESRSRAAMGAIPTIVGHSVAEFDIRFIWQRAMVLGIRLPSWFPRQPKPWSSEVFDTMTAWSGARNRISLDNLCAALGLEGKGDIDGSMVGQMWAEGRHDEIAAYCRQDIERTRACHHRMQVSFGERAA